MWYNLRICVSIIFPCSQEEIDYILHKISVRSKCPGKSCQPQAVDATLSYFRTDKREHVWYEVLT